MVDLRAQYARMKEEIDGAIMQCIESAQFINGPEVAGFQKNLEIYLGCKNVIPCANGTDALQIAMMALGLTRGDEVIVPSFTYVATAEVIALLGLKPVLVDVDPDTFNITAELIEKAITSKSKAIVPVHLFGQCADMKPIIDLASKHNLFIIEDCAQAIGAAYTFSPGVVKKSGTMGTVGCTSFFPSKNLGCFGDGGALYTDDFALAERCRMVANHGQSRKYYHDIIGVNSRLDTIQAAILNVKLKYLDRYCESRIHAAELYDKAFAGNDFIKVPKRSTKSTHVFHQYTVQIPANYRDELKDYLAENGIPSMVYYPVPLYKQKAFASPENDAKQFPVTERLCDTVLSLPMHTEMTEEESLFISGHVLSFLSKKTQYA